MSNLTFQLKDCAIISKPFVNQQKTYAAGKIHYQEGSIDFQKNFHTFNSEAIAQIEASWGAEARFSIDSATITKKPGKKGTQWEDKMFEEFQIDKISLTNGAKKFSARELVDEVKAAFEITDESDDDVPF